MFILLHFICVGTPKAYLLRSRLAANVLCFNSIPSRLFFEQYLSIVDDSMFFGSIK